MSQLIILAQALNKISSHSNNLSAGKPVAAWPFSDLISSPDGLITAKSGRHPIAKKATVLPSGNNITASHITPLLAMLTTPVIPGRLMPPAGTELRERLAGPLTSTGLPDHRSASPRHLPPAATDIMTQSSDQHLPRQSRFPVLPGGDSRQHLPVTGKRPAPAAPARGQHPLTAETPLAAGPRQSVPPIPLFRVPQASPAPVSDHIRPAPVSASTAHTHLPSIIALCSDNGGPLAAGRAMTASTPVSVPADNPAWQQQLSRQVIFMHQQGLHTAELRLHPQELGSLKISLVMKSDQAYLTLLSGHSQVRTVLEAALPDLRHALAGNGISLGGSFVGNEDPSSSSMFTPPDSRQYPSGSPAGSSLASEDPPVMHNTAGVRMLTLTDGRVDLFA
ncbi:MULTISPECIES: flagellar hook-length control protein FliK [unclassified Tatumella]|uniref:flagellar hook-length control protein FliK n=1 Tax=unclassified Tatumella TaxID=2649542 RepID=UPI001BB001DF|nr:MULTISPECIES: flagellar hook-length control protein FliK [unclassified Tatumella]MBS0856701.1 flagellar hook-length control protein FliK [Tatumella sp. JGM16]MBS0912915.1 flagellar hook-length control protein FliK [Tatumella sp. JGM91]